MTMPIIDADIRSADANWSWQSTASTIAMLNSWLQDTGSLTERLRRHCQHFNVQLQATRPHVKLSAEQQGWLGAKQANCREVLLLCDGQPWIYASSLYTQSAEQAVPALAGLGERALGELLFEHPQLTRSAFEFAQLNQAQWQGLQQTQQLTSLVNSTQLLPWARRSVLAIPQAQVLVTELFLPQEHVYQE